MRFQCSINGLAFFWKFFSACLMLGMTACSNVSDNPLLTDQASTSTSATSIDKTPNSSALSLSCDSTSITMPRDASGNPATQVEVTGDCFSSTYGDNNVKAYLVNGLTQGSTALPAMSLQGGTDGKCLKGRFELIVEASGLALGSNSVKVVMTAFDSSGNAVNNDANASRIINIIK